MSLDFDNIDLFNHNIIKDFYDILSEVQQHISANHPSLLSNDIDSKNKKEQIKSIVRKFIYDNSLKAEDLNTDELIEKLCDEMMEFSFLTDYLFSSENNIEEININSWEDIKVNYSNGMTLKTKEKFKSPQHAVDILRKLLRQSNMFLNNSKPITRGHLSNKIRITCCGGDIIDKDVGVSASIRIINPKRLKKEDFIKFGTGTEEMFDFLEIALRYGMSICVGGSTDTGKTTFMSWLLSTVPDKKRIITVEEEVREFNLVKRNEKGEITNNVIHLSTKRGEDKRHDIDQLKLLETSLTMNPDYICMAEMKGSEAYAAQEAGRTGHTIITTVHTNSSISTYPRLATLCGLDNNLDHATLMNLVMEAFPIVIFMKKGEDKVRRIMEIAITTTSQNGNIERVPLWEFITERNEVDENGEIKLIGDFVKKSNLPENVIRILRGNGAPENILQKL